MWQIKMRMQLAFVLMLLMSAAIAEPLQDKDIEVNVKIIGERVIVDLTMPVAATQQEVWEVLTDFDHMAEFISNLKESKVIERSKTTMKVYQRGIASYGPVEFSFESTRETSLSPIEKIQSHMLAGNMISMEGTTQLSVEGELTRIFYHNESVPGHWIPPVVGKTFIEHETRKQYQEIRAEVLKRKLTLPTSKIN